jgi:O-methyltransferase
MARGHHRTIQARNLGLRDKVYACDTFSGVVKAGDEDPDYVGGEHADTSRHSVEERFYQTLKLDNVEILTGIFPEDTGDQVDNLKFRLCHIDVDVYQRYVNSQLQLKDRIVLHNLNGHAIVIKR